MQSSKFSTQTTITFISGKVNGPPFVDVFLVSDPADLRGLSSLLLLLEARGGRGRPIEDVDESMLSSDMKESLLAADKEKKYLHKGGDPDVYLSPSSDDK